MNTNINNKKFKLVSLRNQPMQAFSCKRECDKEASGLTRKGKERAGYIERLVTEVGRFLGERERVKTGRKKNYDDPSSDSFSLTTLKNRWTLFLIVVIVNPHVFGFPFIPWLVPFTFILPVFTTVVCRPNHRRKNVTPRTVLLWSIHMYTYLYIGKRSQSKILFMFFSFSLSVTSWYTGRVG